MRWCALFILLLMVNGACAQEMIRSFVFMVTSYNNDKWCHRNLQSLLDQEYDQYRIVYIDDCSTDGTYDLVHELCESWGRETPVLLQRNTIRIGKMANIYRAIHACADHEIVVMIDGDDWLDNNQVLSYLNTVYQDPSVWLTYGQFILYPKSMHGIPPSEPLPTEVVNNKSYREHQWVTSHVHTFYAYLFKQIKKADFMYQGEFLSVNADMAYMLPLLELADGRFHFVPDVLYQYNVSNPMSDFRLALAKQKECAQYLRALPRYQPLSGPLEWRMNAITSKSAVLKK